MQYGPIRVAVRSSTWMPERGPLGERSLALDCDSLVMLGHAKCGGLVSAGHRSIRTSTMASRAGHEGRPATERIALPDSILSIYMNLSFTTMPSCGIMD